MTLRYAVGIKIGNRADQMTVEAEDALIAALKVKTAHPEAAITYVRKRNARGDRRQNLLDHLTTSSPEASWNYRHSAATDRAHAPSWRSQSAVRCRLS